MLRIIESNKFSFLPLAQANPFISKHIKPTAYSPPQLEVLWTSKTLGFRVDSWVSSSAPLCFLSNLLQVHTWCPHPPTSEESPWFFSLLLSHWQACHSRLDIGSTHFSPIPLSAQPRWAPSLAWTTIESPNTPCTLSPTDSSLQWQELSSCNRDQMAHKV